MIFSPACSVIVKKSGSFAAPLLSIWPAIVAEGKSSVGRLGLLAMLNVLRSMICAVAPLSLGSGVSLMIVVVGSATSVMVSVTALAAPAAALSLAMTLNE